jgi:hypothetical protein
MKEKTWIVSAFCTTNTPYEEEVKTRLVPSLQKLDIPYYIEAVQNKGNWKTNVAYKPKALYHALEKNPLLNVVGLDADCKVLEYPDLFDNIPLEYDIALHKLDWKTWYGHNVEKKEVLSGTIFLRNTEAVKNLVKEWYERAIKSNTWEQQVLAQLLEEKKIPVYELPLSYCYINSLPNGESPKVVIENPVIVHYQASRIYKKRLIL